MAKILIVEDNPNNMKLAQLLLESSGHEVLQAVNALDGLDIARSLLPAVILMDIQLPGMDGLTATRLLKEDAQTSHIKIIALTAFAMKGDEEKMRQAGCDSYIAKPIRYKEFLQTVDALL
ncbi:response regulator [Methylophilus sp. QUAN]|uniref:response regulator n=1 Tax=Methylophilus sp. QUAN TaxID=2781020 RepID=UPI00188E8C66|nr:response regulator [Methylophilus sp. QUAN]MBF4991797.1 response regulator [Methylophilus sp. QUAN]